MRARNLRNLTRSELIDQTKQLVAHERALNLEILEFLREIESRRLHLEMGYGSLHEFLVQELRYPYSDGAAARRVQSMRLSRQVPEVKEALKTGEVSLSTAAKLETFFRTEEKHGRAYPTQEKRQLFEQIKNKSARATEQLLCGISPEFRQATQDRARVVSPEETEIRFRASAVLMEKLERLRGLLAHQLPPNCSYAELFEKLSDLALARVEKRQAGSSKPKTSEQAQTNTHPDVTTFSATAGPSASSAKPALAQAPAPSPAPSRNSPDRSRYIPAQLRREVFEKAQGQCCYIDPISGRRCTSRFALQFEHIHPLGKGGETTPENLEVLCRQHNALRAIQQFGHRKMAHYLTGLG